MKNRLMTVFLCLGLLTAYFACEKDDSIAKEEQIVDTSGPQLTPTIKSVSFDAVGEKFNRLKNQYQLDGFLQSSSETNLLSRSSIDTLGVTIYIDDIKEITLGDYTSYTMLIELPDSDSTKFYNLTIEYKNGVEGMFLTKYVPTQSWIDDKDKAYEGSVSTKRVDALTNEFPPDGGGEVDNNLYPQDCDGEIIETTFLWPYQCECPGGHWPAEVDECTCEPKTGYYPKTIDECIPINDQDPDPNDTSNPNTGGPGGPGGNTDGGDEGDGSYTTIVTEDGECDVIPPASLNGDCIIDDYERLIFQLQISDQSTRDFIIQNTIVSDQIINYLVVNSYSNGSREFAKLAIEALNNDGIDDGEVDFDDAIILDETVINNQKLKCVYDKLKGLSNTFFKDIIQSQFGSSNTNHIKITLGSIPPQLSGQDAFTYTTYVNGSDVDFEQGNIKHIRIDPDFISTSSTIGIAYAIIHEFIHAEIMDRCIKLGLIQEIGLLGETTLLSDPTIYTLTEIIFYQLLLQYNAYEPGDSPNANPQWNHDLFNALNYRSIMAQDLVSIHQLLNDSNNDFLSNVNNDPNVVNGPYTLIELMDYISWIGLEGTQDYTTNIANVPTELARKNYAASAAGNHYTHNCTN